MSSQNSRGSVPTESSPKGLARNINCSREPRGLLSHAIRDCTSIITKTIGVALLFTSGCTSTPPYNAMSPRTQQPTLNEYVLQAIETPSRDYLGLGYGNQAFTHDLSFGDQGMLQASKKPLTMCVAAQLEILIEALDLEARDSHDYRAFTFLPKNSWERLRPTDLRGQIWIVTGAAGHGMADALTNLGMGEKHSFDRWKPGDFVNFNRTNGSGHGVVFLGYLDKNARELPAFGDDVVGFKYFSSQGKLNSGGLGYRYAFFAPLCPILPNDKKRDCGVIRTSEARLLNGGSAWLPSAWNSATATSFLASHRTRFEAEGSFNSQYFTGMTTDD
jgi:hypothetical protein